MCIAPIEIHARKKTEEWSEKHHVPCGKCYECLNAKSTSWALRLQEEEKKASNSYFITLTYNDETIPVIHVLTGKIKRGLNHALTNKYYVRTLQKSDLQKLFKRYREKFYQEITKTDGEICPFRYYAVGEYGGKTKRPHYHILAFNVELEMFLNEWRLKDNKIGRVDVGKVENGSIKYCANYIHTKYEYKGRKQNPPFSLMSKGIGRTYIDDMQEYHYNNMEGLITLKGGMKAVMPRYWKERIFEEKERKLIGDYHHFMAMQKRDEEPTYYIHARQARKKHIFNNSKKSKL